MKKITISFLVLFAATGCTTPMTTLKNPTTGQVATCGGSATGSFIGGAIGYHMQKDNDSNCVSTYQKQGFEIIEVKEK